MVKERVISQRKLDYRARLEKCFRDYKNILIIGVDNVGSNQLQKIRIALRGKATIVMGKNTIIRKILRGMIEENPKLEKLLPLVWMNIGFVFTNEDIQAIRQVVVSYRVPAAARVGSVAPVDCIVPAGPTGLDPGQTNFFQVLNIGTKIVKGSIEIVSDVALIKAGEKVNASHVSLLAKLDIKPFFYGVTINTVYDDGAVYPASLLDLSHNDLMGKFLSAVQKQTLVSLAIGWPTATTVPHMLARAYTNLLSLAVTTDIKFEQAERYKLFFEDPAAYTAKYGGAASGGAAPAAGGAAPAKQAEAAKAPEPEPEEEDIGLGGGLFD